MVWAAILIFLNITELSSEGSEGQFIDKMANPLINISLHAK